MVPPEGGHSAMEGQVGIKVYLSLVSTYIYIYVSIERERERDAFGKGSFGRPPMESQWAPEFVMGVTT